MAPNPAGRTSAARGAIFVAVLLLTLAACAAPGRPASPHVAHLRFAVFDSITDSEQAFADAALAESHGTVRISLLDNWGKDVIADEVSEVRAISAGTVDGGFPATRAFSSAGISGMGAVEAPLLLDDYASEGELVTGPASRQVLSSLDGSGMIGLKLVAAGIRRPVAAGAPLLSPADWRGKTVAYLHAPAETSVEGRTISALGAKPVYVGNHGIEDVKAKLYQVTTPEVAGVTTDDLAGGDPSMTANVELWPKVIVITMNRTSLAGLTASQRGALRRAAAQMSADSVASPPDEAAAVTGLCAAGARFGVATAAQLTAMRAAVQPVYDWIATKPAERKLLGQLQSIAKNHPESAALDIPADCRWIGGPAG